MIKVKWITSPEACPAEIFSRQKPGGGLIVSENRGLIPQEIIDEVSERVVFVAVISR